MQADTIEDIRRPTIAIGLLPLLRSQLTSKRVNNYVTRKLAVGVERTSKGQRIISLAGVIHMHLMDAVVGQTPSMAAASIVATRGVAWFEQRFADGDRHFDSTPGEPGGGEMLLAFWPREDGGAQAFLFTPHAIFEDLSKTVRIGAVDQLHPEEILRRSSLDSSLGVLPVNFSICRVEHFFFDLWRGFNSLDEELNAKALENRLARLPDSLEG